MFVQLKLRTEYSFKTAYGPIDQVIAKLKAMDCHAAAITDRSSTFGHVNFNRLCKQNDIKPIFGVELAFTPDVTVKEKRQELYWLSLLARNNAGLQEIYATVEEATKNFHYIPRMEISSLDSFSEDVYILSGNSGIGQHNAALPKRVIVEAHPATSPALYSLEHWNVPVSDNYMIDPGNRDIYEILCGRGAFNRSSPMHILNHFEMKNECGWLNASHFQTAILMANECNATLEPATNIKAFETKTLLELCIEGAKEHNLPLIGDYRDRMQYELSLIETKGFTDYFMVIADMVKYAKTQMLVGPARGSSCGSLVCYLLGITDIDPLPHKLIFERFIDVTREDLPDIDIDFQDNKRDLVFEYLINKYGKDKVARLGTISRYKAKSAIGETAKAIRIPHYESEQIADNIIKRNDGDDRSDNCIADTFNETDVGQAYLAKYPNIIVAAKLEAHSRHSGTHAAGIVITNEPINHYVSRDMRNNTIHLDKYDAEKINLMKVDALGLGTLTIIADCLEQIGWDKQRLLAHPLDDDKAFEVLRNYHFCGIFQFAGTAVQSLARQIHIDRFADMVALIALPRPGPLVSGAANEWCARRMGRSNVQLLHTMMESITGDTYGLIVYQEQMLRIIREIGGLSWADCAAFRRGINKKLGMEYFDAQWWDKFKSGAQQHGIDEILARQIWETVNGAGGYCFNLSHAVAYGMVAYWCAVLKAHHPLQFALATLKYTADPLSVKQYLRELDRSGYTFKPYDAEKSELSWSVKGNELLGGLTNIIGVGSVMANEILFRRKNDTGYTIRQEKLLATGKTKFDDVFEVRTKFKHLLAEPRKYGIVSKLWQLADIDIIEGNYVFIAKVISFKVRSLNEMQFLVKRNNMRVPDDKWLTMVLEDDSGIINATISRRDFPRFGLPITKEYRNDQYFLFRGFVKQGNRRVYIEKFRPLTEEKNNA